MLILTGRPPPRSTLFPYTTLFRSHDDVRAGLLDLLDLSGEVGRVLIERQNEDRGGHPELRKILDQRVGFALGDRKSTRLNSSHMSISYAVFCLKKKSKVHTDDLRP